MMKRKLRIGQIGLGDLGWVHAENIALHIPNATLTAVCATTPEKIRRAQDEWDVPYGYTDFDEMLKNPDIDAISIVTPTSIHYGQAMAAIAAGKHVFCEKPTGNTLAECIEIEKAAAAHDALFMVAFMRRYDPSFVDAKRRIDAGEIGDIVLYRGYTLDPLWHGVRHAGRASSKRRWLVDCGVHEYDQLRWMCGVEADKAYCNGGAYVFDEFKPFQDVDNGCTLIKLANGASAFVYLGRTAPHGSHCEVEIVGTKGMLRVCGTPARTDVLQYTERGLVQDAIPYYLDRWKDAYRAEMQAFVNGALTGDYTGLPTAHDASAASRMGEMVQRSYLQDALISLSDIPDR